MCRPFDFLDPFESLESLDILDKFPNVTKG